MDDGYDEDPKGVCTLAAIPLVCANLRQAFIGPEGCEISWDDVAGPSEYDSRPDVLEFNARWTSPTGRLLDVNGPMDGPREMVAHRHIWAFYPFPLEQAAFVVEPTP